MCLDAEARQRRAAEQTRPRSVSLGCVLLLGAIACRTPANDRDVPPPAPAPRAAPDGDARLVLETHCGLCHREDSSKAMKRALAVFNLNRVDWYASISD